MKSIVTTCVTVAAAFYIVFFGCGRVSRLASKEVPVKRRLVDDLVSVNKAPLLAGNRSKPSFDSSFDWSEQKRVLAVADKLFKSATENWGSITECMSVDAYSVTIMTFNGSTYNWTVGDVCRRVASMTLSDAYYDYLTPETREIYVVFRDPAFARDSKQFKKWLDARSQKTLAELQADACEWAIQRMAQPVEEDEVPWSDKDRARWTAAIRKTADALRAGKGPIRSKGFGREEFMPYRNDSRAE